MIAAHLEPNGLDRDATPIADFVQVGNDRANAVDGSLKLRTAILRLGKVKAVRKIIPKRPRTWTARKSAKGNVLRIRCEVAEYFGRAVADMISKRGVGTMCLHRQIAMYLARECTTASYLDIGKQFGDRDHTTVIHSCRQIEDRLGYDLRVRADVATLRSMIAEAAMPERYPER